VNGIAHTLDPAEEPIAGYTRKDKYIIADTSAIGEAGSEGLRRSFDVLSSIETPRYQQPYGSNSDGDDEVSTYSSMLEGRVVVFSGPALEKARLLDQKEGEERLVSGLIPDLDFRALKPSSDVGVGQEWEVKNSMYFLLPAGNLWFEDQEDPGLGGEDTELDRQFQEHIKSETFATLREVRVKEGTRILIVAVRSKFTTYADWKPEQNNEEHGIRIEQSCRIEQEVEVNGLLQWNEDQGHMKDIEMDGRILERKLTTTVINTADSRIDSQEERVYKGTVDLKCISEF
jgi:hypothetical protein